MWLIQWSADRWIAFSAVIVALCALIVSVHEGRATREHDRLSVKPYLEIDFDYTDKGAGFLLLNEGLGPAVIRSFVVHVDGKPQRTWHTATDALGLPKTHTWFKRVPSPNIIWRPHDQEQRVFWIDKSPASDQLKEQQHRVDIKVCYCSLYDECWSRTRTIEAPKKSSCDHAQNQLVSD